MLACADHPEAANRRTLSFELLLFGDWVGDGYRVGREFESGNRTLYKLKDIYHASLIPAFSEPTETLVVACTHQRLDERERLPLTGEQRCLHSAREGFLPNCFLESDVTSFFTVASGTSTAWQTTRVTSFS